MKRSARLALALLAGLAIPLLIGAAASTQWKYPPTKTGDAADTYFGKTYKDPYRWLENLKDKDVEAWFKAQAKLTDGLLAKIPAKDALAKEWMALDKLRPAKYTAITFEHGRVFYKKTLGGENVGKLFFREGWAGADTGPHDARRTVRLGGPSVAYTCGQSIRSARTGRRGSAPLRRLSAITTPAPPSGETSASEAVPLTPPSCP